MDCAFCRIVSEPSASVVHADDRVVAFLDRSPATRGHTLVVTREHHPDIWAIDPIEAEAVMRVATELARAARDVLGATGVNLKQNNGEIAGQDVMHFHLHVIPRYPGDGVQPGCVWGAPPWEAPSLTERDIAEISAALRGSLRFG